MQEVVILAIVCCWIGEWSKLIQMLAWWTKQDWINMFACAKCWGFSFGLIVFLNKYDLGQSLTLAVLCSATAMVLNKLYIRL